MSIGLLRDEDFVSLMATSEGREAFGVFVALVIAARERYAEGRAVEVIGSDSVRFLDSTAHLCNLISLTTNQVEIILKTLEAVARQNHSEPWVYLDKSGHVVIRSFLKYNVNRDWGGSRSNAGRPAKKNQLELSNDPPLETSIDNQDGAPPTPSPSPFPSPPPGGGARAPAPAREGGLPVDRAPGRDRATPRPSRPTSATFDALVAKARTLCPDSRFADALLDAWAHDGRFIARWEEWPTWVFLDALDEYSTAEPPLTVRMYLKFCLTRHSRGPLNQERRQPHDTPDAQEPEREYEKLGRRWKKEHKPA